jgi:hypothetical protein
LARVIEYDERGMAGVRLDVSGMFHIARSAI